MNASVPLKAQSHPLLAGLPASVTTPEEALPLAKLIDEQVPLELRADASQHMSLSVWLKRAEHARLNGDVQNLRIFEGQVVHMHPFALNALGRFLAERDGGKALTSMPTQVAAPCSPPRSRGKAGAALAARPTTTIAVPVVASPPTEEVNRTVLSAAPSVMQLAQASSGMAAVVFEFVRREGLFKQAGYKSMADYAAARLRVTGETYRKYGQAGRAAWEHYPEGAHETVVYVSGAARGEHSLLPPGVGAGHSGPGTRVPPNALPTVPPVSLLKELPRALRRTDASEHAAIIAAVAAGTVTYEELHQKGRVSNATEESPVPTERDVAESDTDSSSSNEHRPGIFANLDELEKVAGSTRTALAQLNELVEAWKDDGGPDVDPILPRVRAIAGRLRSVATELENHILPEKVCARCCGEGCRACRGMGVNDRGDPEESDRYELRQSAGGVRVLGRRTMGRFRQRAAFSSFERSRVGRRGQVQVVVAKSRPRCRGRGSAG